MAYSTCQPITKYERDGSLKSRSVSDMFNRMVPPFLAAWLLDAAFAKPATTSSSAPSAAMKTESQSLLCM